MSASPERWILCGGASHPDAPDDAIALSVAGDDKNLTVDIAGITETLTGRVPPAFRDLILIASYVLAADQAVKRGDADDTDMGKKWRRTFRFVIGVECPDLWTAPEMAQLLVRTLGFLSDDYYTFEFQQGTIRPHEQLSLANPKGEPFLSWDHVEEVVLFSGGLDSLAGAVEQFVRDKRSVILVSHRSATKTVKTQRDLISDMRELAPDRVLPHVGIQVVRHDNSLRKERTQRSRSFLYAAIAGAVAHLIGKRRINFYENGVVALNLPVSRQVVGAKATRTAHPKVLKGFAQILSLVAGETFEVRNPFELKTRAEVIQHLADCGGEKLIKYAVSCAYVTSKTRRHPHCGVCSQCVDRQFSMRAAGLQDADSDEGYEVHLVNDEWEKEGARGMLIDYVDAAARFARCENKEQFLSEFGEMTRAVQGLYDGMSHDAEAIGQAVFELHKRHGDGVMKVVAGILGSNPEQFVLGDLKPNSVPALLSRAGLQRCGAVDDDSSDGNASPWTGGENMFVPHGDMWLVRFRGGQIYPLKDQRGMSHIHTLLQHPGDVICTNALTSIADGQPVAEDALQISLDADQDAVNSIKGVVQQLQDELEEAKEFCNDDDVARIEAELEQYGAWLAQETRRGGKAGRELKAIKKSRDRVTKAIRLALAGIKKHSAPLAAHLDDELDRGHLMRYRRTGLAWDLDLRNPA